MIVFGPPFDRLFPGGIERLECLDCGLKWDWDRPAGAMSCHHRCTCGAYLVREGTTREDVEKLKRLVQEILNSDKYKP